MTKKQKKTFGFENVEAKNNGWASAYFGMRVRGVWYYVDNYNVFINTETCKLI